LLETINGSNVALKDAQGAQVEEENSSIKPLLATP